MGPLEAVIFGLMLLWMFLSWVFKVLHVSTWLTYDFWEYLCEELDLPLWKRWRRRRESDRESTSAH